jgi:putative phosphoesterase
METDVVIENVIKITSRRDSASPGGVFSEVKQRRASVRLLFISDIHGSPDSLGRLSRHMEAWPPDQLVILGDVLYHGPRNALRPDYSPREVCDWLNRHKRRIVAVRGNCDSEVDQAMLDFPLLADYSNLLVDGHRFFLTHGHHYHPGHPPPLGSGDVLAYGHTHIPQLAVLDERLVAFNPGSLSLPKAAMPPSFGKYDQGVLQVVNLETGVAMLSLNLELEKSTWV